PYIDIGGAALTNLSTPAGQSIVRSFVTPTSSGVNELRFVGLSSVDPNFVLNAIDVRPAAGTFAISIARTGNNGVVADDGTTVDTFTGTILGGTLADGTLISVSTTAGTITDADLSSLYEGTQVAVSGNAFTFHVQRPTGTVPLVLRAISVDANPS